MDCRQRWIAGERTLLMPIRQRFYCRGIARGVSRVAGIALIVAAIATSGCGRSDRSIGHQAGPGPASEYDTLLLNQTRQAKDAAFRESDSPILPEQRAQFAGLKYFPPAPELAFTVNLTKIEPPEVIRVAATKGDVRSMLRYGRFDFVVNGVACSLTVFKSDPESASLFVPFRDATSGKETYEVGRYLDLEEHDDDAPYLLDFNQAYNPYCAYNYDYTCPVVPRENVLKIPIRAGERVPHEPAE